MTLNTIRKIFFTNILIERFFIILLKKNILIGIINKMLPVNILYKNGSYRKVRRNNVNYLLDISDYQEWLIYFLSKNDSSLTLLERIGEPEIIIDIGANIGQTTLAINEKLLKSEKMFQIICFEPYPENFFKLKTNLDLNNKKFITNENIALGSENGKAKMFKDCISNSGGNRVVYSQKDNISGVVEIEMKTLDQYLFTNKINKVDFIKIDVEGFEFSVLKGAKNTLKDLRPNLFIELDDINLNKQGSSASELIEFLESFNYEIEDIENQYSTEELKKNSIHTDIWCIKKN